MKKPRVLKLNFRNITEVDLLKESIIHLYCEIEELSLNHNKLTSLANLS